MCAEREGEVRVIGGCKSGEEWEAQDGDWDFGAEEECWVLGFRF